MSKISKKYIKEVKAMFPVKGKKERLYLKNLARDVEMLCEEENITNKEELYEKYGKPFDVAAEYFSTVDTAYVFKKIKISKYIKVLVAVVIAIVIALSSMVAVFMWEQQQMLLRQEMVDVEEVIEVIEE